MTTTGLEKSLRELAWHHTGRPLEQTLLAAADIVAEHARQPQGFAAAFEPFAELEELRAKVAALENAVSLYKDSDRSLSAKVASLEKEPDRIIKLMRENDALAAENAELRQGLEDFYSSTGQL